MQMPLFTPEELQKVEEIKSRYPTRLGAVMGVLHMVQDKFGFISVERMQEVADLLVIPVENVLGVVSFYEMYHEHPVGKYNLQVCTNISCLLRNSDLVLATLKERLGIEPGEVTADGKFGIHEVECLGSCGSAPMMSVNKKYEESLTREKVNKIIDELMVEG